MSEPIRASFSLAEIQAKLTEWMVEQYGHPLTLKGRFRDKWHEREGMIHHFLICQFPDENGKTFERPTTNEP